MFFGAIACFLHALLPFAFQHTGSDCIESLHERMVVKRRGIIRPIAAHATRAGAAR
jgi:hypothetical protein